MTDTLLTHLATSAGIVTEWTDALGQVHVVSPEVQRALLQSLGYPSGTESQLQDSLREATQSVSQRPLPGLITGDSNSPVFVGGAAPTGARFSITATNDGIGEPLDVMVEGTLTDTRLLPALRAGYYLLEINSSQHTLAIAPPACPGVDELRGQHNAHLWGLSTQLYSLRRPGAFGIGDTGALEDLARSAAALGADALAISPVHAGSASGFDFFSPYSPSSRLFLNVFHAAPDLILGTAAVEHAIDQCQLRDSLRRLEALELIDWAAVHQTYSVLLRQLHRNFIAENHPLTPDFQHFVQQGGVALQDHCRFEAIHEHQLGLRQNGDWHHWPESLRDPGNPAVAKFAARHDEVIACHGFCQWLASRSLQRAQRSARDAGMHVGLISDLAVGANIGGSQTWTRKDEFLHNVGVGAPPDFINTQGQNWRVAAFSPKGLQEHGFRAYIEMLRANLAYCGGIRIDHVMGLERLWLIPDGATPSHQGAYVRYPFKDMLRLLTLEATRHNALVIGEDLGTVRPGLREELAQRNILGTRVLFFEQQHQDFIPSQQWPKNVMATTTTHDLPSIRGWFAGRDIQWRAEAGYLSQDQADAEHVQRRKDIGALTDRLHQEGLLDEHEHSATARLDASLSFVASTPSCLVMVPLEDIMASEEQPNLPGPGSIHPNWRRRWTVAAGNMFDSKEVRQRIQRLAAARTQARETDSD